MNRLKWIILILTIATTINSQDTIRIALINDRDLESNRMEYDFHQGFKNEILQLLQHRYTVIFNNYHLSEPNETIQEKFEHAFEDNDIVTCIGTESSGFSITLDSYPKPTIASLVMDPDLQGLTKKENGTSGIHNFAYLESPFDLNRDIDLLYRISPFDHLIIVSPNNTMANETFFEALFAKVLQDKEVKIENVFHGTDISAWVADHDLEKHAIYILPYLGDDTSYIENLFDLLNNQYKIPTVALMGEEYLKSGALAGYETEKNIRKIPRRLALSILRILEGQNASDLSVEIETFGENLMINMATARKIGIYPDFDLMGEAQIINLVRDEDVSQITFQQTIAEALRNNLEIKIQQTDVKISDTEIGIAKADLLPQVDVASSLSYLDENSTLSYQGAQGRTNWFLSGNFSQIIFSEPILANVAIQKLLKESETQDLIQTQMDVIVDVASAYMNILFAKSNLNIQLQNVDRTKENYDISKAKETIGYSGASDINRWEAELANANIELNNAYANLRQAKFLLNQLLDRPIDEPFDVEDISLENSMTFITDKRSEFIDNYGKIEKFADFLVDYSQDYLPELKQIILGLKVEERIKSSRNRSLYLPTVGLTGSANRILGKYAIPEGLPSRENNTTWNIGVAATIPIFQGNRRINQIQQSRLNIMQLKETRQNVENQLELQIRSNIEIIGASYSRVELSQKAAKASRKNYDIVRDAYSSGQANITTLIDAQNNALATQLSANNAIYTFILDFLLLERSIGVFNFLSTPSEREEFFLRAQEFITQN